MKNNDIGNLKFIEDLDFNENKIKNNLKLELKKENYGSHPVHSDEELFVHRLT